MKNNSENKTKKKGNRQAKEQVSPYIFKKKNIEFLFFIKQGKQQLTKQRKRGKIRKKSYKSS